MNRKVPATSGSNERDVELGVVSSPFDENKDRVADTLTATANDNSTDVTQIFSEKLLGKPHTGWRNFFYQFDPFFVTQHVRAPKMYNDANAVFSLVYFAGIIWYVVFAIDGYYNQNPIEKNSLVLATTLSPISLNISTTCSKTWHCGNFTKESGSWTLVNPIYVKETWNKVSKSSPCYGKSRNYTIPENANFHTTVCYSPDSNDGVSLNVPFRSSYSSGVSLVVDIKGDSTKYTNEMNSNVVMEPTQHKTVFFSQVQYKYEGAPTDNQPYPAVGIALPCYNTLLFRFLAFPYPVSVFISMPQDYFYNGHGTDSTAATVLFKLQQFSYQVTSTNAVTVWSTAGSIGGFVALWLSLTSMTRGIGMMAYATWGMQSVGGQLGLGMNICQLCFVNVLACFKLVTMNDKP